MVKFGLSVKEKNIIWLTIFVCTCMFFYGVGSTIIKVIADYERVQIEKAQEDLYLLNGIRNVRIKESDMRFNVLKNLPVFKRYIEHDACAISRL